MTRPPVPRSTTVLAALAATGALALCAAAAVPAHAGDAGAVGAGVVDLPGEQIAQSSDASEPTPVTVGAWRGDLGPYESGDGIRWFAYERVTDDSTLLVSVISTGAEPSGRDGIDVQVLTPGGEECTFTGASSDRGDDEGLLLAAELVIGTQEAALPPDEADGYRCLNEDRLVIRVSRGSDGAAGVAPYAMRVVEEAPLEPDAELAGALELGDAEAPDVDSEREDLDGGSSLTDAPEVSDGRYRGTTTTDRTVLYRVPDVGWGQTLRTSVSVDEVDLGGAFSGPDVSLRVLTPMWTSFGTSGTVEDGLSDDGSVRLVASAGPVRYANRVAGPGADAPVHAPGDHYVMVTVAAPDEGGPVDVAYTLEVEVAGDAEDAPAFTSDDAYLVADSEEQPTITAVDAGGLLATAVTALRYAGAGLLALVGVVALLAGVRTLRT